MKNVKDNRIVVVSVLRDDATNLMVEKFLKELTSNAAKAEDSSDLRKYDYYSFNIIEPKLLYKNDTSDKLEFLPVLDNNVENVKPWMKVKKIPRRLIIHFINEFDDQSVKDLTNDIHLLESHK